MATDWGKIGAIGSLIGGLAAAAALIPTVLVPMLNTPNQAQPAVSTSPAAPAASSGQPAPAASASPARPAVAGDCVSSTGASASCAEPGSLLVTSANPCTSDAAQAALTIDTHLRPLNVEAVTIKTMCALRPSALATAAGATAEDIRRAATGEAIASLASCYATTAGPEVACSQPHVIEFIGRWTAWDGHSPAKTLCDDAARRYTGRTFDEPSQPLKLILPTGSGQYRCAVQAPSPLTKSVWRIGGNPL